MGTGAAAEAAEAARGAEEAAYRAMGEELERRLGIYFATKGVALGLRAE